MVCISVSLGFRQKPSDTALLSVIALTTFNCIVSASVTKGQLVCFVVTVHWWRHRIYFDVTEARRALRNILTVHLNNGATRADLRGITALMIRNSSWNYLCRFCVDLSMHSNSTITRSFYWRYAETIGRYSACWLQLEGQLGSLYTQSKAYNQPALNMCHIVWLQSKSHDDVIKWEHFPRHWPFVRGVNRSPGNSPHKGLWRWALMFPLICAWKNGWVNNGEAGDLRHRRAHYDINVMNSVRKLSRSHGNVNSLQLGYISQFAHDTVHIYSSLLLEYILLITPVNRTLELQSSPPQEGKTYHTYYTCQMHVYPGLSNLICQSAPDNMLKQRYTTFKTAGYDLHSHQQFASIYWLSISAKIRFITRLYIWLKTVHWNYPIIQVFVFKKIRNLAFRPFSSEKYFRWAIQAASLGVIWSDWVQSEAFGKYANTSTTYQFQRIACHTGVNSNDVRYMAFKVAKRCAIILYVYINIWIWVRSEKYGCFVTWFCNWCYMVLIIRALTHMWLCLSM